MGIGVKIQKMRGTYLTRGKRTVSPISPFLFWSRTGIVNQGFSTRAGGESARAAALP